MFICIYGNNILSISVRSDLCYKLQSEARSVFITDYSLIKGQRQKPGE